MCVHIWTPAFNHGRQTVQMGEKPKFVVVHGVTGECREYFTDNVAELDQSIECVDKHFKQIERAKQNASKSRQAEHIRLMQEKAAEYVETDGFQGSYSAVLLLMLGTAKYGGRVPLTKEQIGEKLKYSRQTVGRAVAHLKQNGMIFESEHEGRPYFFLPSLAAQKGHETIKGTDDVAAMHKRRAELKILQGGKA